MIFSGNKQVAQRISL